MKMEEMQKGMLVKDHYDGGFLIKILLKSALYPEETRWRTVTFFDDGGTSVDDPYEFFEILQEDLRCLEKI